MRSLFLFVLFISWIANIVLLSYYIGLHDDEVSRDLCIPTLVFVALTGVVPMLRAAARAAKKRKYKYRLVNYLSSVDEEFWSIVHVFFGVLSTFFSGLVLGEAAKCNKESYDYIELLIWAAIANGLSGISAHLGFDIREGKPEIRDSGVGYGVIAVGSLLALIGHASANYENTSVSCIKEPKIFGVQLLLWSPIIHLAAFAIMFIMAIEKTNFWVPILRFIKFPVMYIAAILSVFNAMYSFGRPSDFLILIPVYILIGYIHII